MRKHFSHQHNIVYHLSTPRFHRKLVKEFMTGDIKKLNCLLKEYKYLLRNVKNMVLVTHVVVAKITFNMIYDIII